MRKLAVRPRGDGSGERSPSWRRCCVGRPELGERLESPRGAADLGGSVRGQHRPVRVPVAGQAGHADDRQQLHPRRGSRRRAELLHVLAVGPVRHLSSTGTATGSRTCRTTSASSGSTGAFFLGDTVQPYTVTRVANGKSTVIAHGTTPPNNIGPALDAELPRTRDEGRRRRSQGGGQVFAGQRDDPFFADVGDIFDLLAIRKGTGNAGGGKDFLAGYAVHTIALQIPISQIDTPRRTSSACGRPQIAADATVNGKRSAASGCRSRGSATR